MTMEIVKNLTLTSISSANHSLTWSADEAPAKKSVVLLGVRMAITLSSLGLNLGVVVFHLVKPVYITDFTTYLLFLYMANCVYIIGNQPLQFWSEFSHQDIGSLGQSVCLFYNYIQRVFSVVPVMGHVAIALNRLWAVQYAIHYRDKHNKKVAMLVCLAMAGYVHIVNMIPFFIYLPYRYQAITASTGNCTDSYVLAAWIGADSFFNRFGPLFVIVIVYIYLIIKRFSRRQTVKRNDMTMARTGEVQGTDGQQGNAARTVGSQQTMPRQPPLPLPRRIVRPFLVLTLTTAEVLTCWMTLDFIYLCQWFFGVYFSPTIFLAFHLLYTLQSLFDPLMWFISLRFRRADA